MVAANVSHGLIRALGIALLLGFCGSPLAAQGGNLTLVIKKINGWPERPSALIAYRGANGVYTPGDERIGAFRVQEIAADRVIVFSLADQSEKTFYLEGAQSAPAGHSGQTSPVSVAPTSGSSSSGSSHQPSGPVTAAPGKGPFKIRGIIGKAGTYSIMMDQDGVQLSLAVGQTIARQFTITAVQGDAVSIKHLNDGSTISYVVGSEIPFSDKGP